MMLADRLNADLQRKAAEMAAANGTTPDAEMAALKMAMAEKAAIDAPTLDGILAGGPVDIVTDAHLAAFAEVLGSALADLQSALMADRQAGAMPEVPEMEIEYETMAAKLKSSVIRIACAGSHGSGVMLDDGQIVTAYHVIEGQPEGFEVRSADGKTLTTGKVERIDPSRDLATISTAKSLPGHRVSVRAANPEQGDDVLVIGYPSAGGKEFGGMFTRGCVSYIEGDMIHTDATINPGNSGGGMFVDGELVAIVSARYLDNGFFGSGGPVGVAYGYGHEGLTNFLKGDIQTMSATNQNEATALLNRLAGDVARMHQSVNAVVAETAALRCAASAAADGVAKQAAGTEEVKSLRAEVARLQRQTAGAILQQSKVPAGLHPMMLDQVVARVVAKETPEAIVASLDAAVEAKPEGVAAQPPTVTVTAPKGGEQPPANKPKPFARPDGQPHTVPMGAAAVGEFYAKMGAARATN